MDDLPICVRAFDPGPHCGLPKLLRAYTQCFLIEEPSSSLPFEGILCKCRERFRIKDSVGIHLWGCWRLNHQLRSATWRYRQSHSTSWRGFQHWQRMRYISRSAGNGALNETVFSPFPFKQRCLFTGLGHFRPGIFAGRQGNTGTSPQRRKRQFAALQYYQVFPRRSK